MIRRKCINLLFQFVKIVFAIIVSAIILSAFAVVYDNTGIKIKDDSGATGAKWAGKQFVSNMTEGFGWFLTDNNGYNNNTYPSSIDVLFMGNSHFEAQQVMQYQNVSSLTELESGLSTYNIGVSGNHIEYCVKSMEYALERYKPSRYIIFNISSVNIDTKKMIEALESQPSESDVQFTSGLMYYIKQIPCVKPMLYQIQQWMKNDNVNEVAQIDEKSGAAKTEDYYKVLNQFLLTCRERATQYGVIPVIVYQPSLKLNKNGNIEFIDDEMNILLFTNICAEHGIVFVNMQSQFEELYEKNKILPYGFVNTHVGQGHLNKYGHRIMATTLSDVLMNGGEE